MNRRTPWLIVFITLTGAALRWRPVFANTFAADEALFARWATLIASWWDPLLLQTPVDKPPLAIYLQALTIRLAGRVAWAARLPSFAASVALIPLTARLTRQTTRRNTPPGAAPAIAAAIVALSPLAIQLSGTALLDPVLTTLLVAALTTAAKPGRTGFLFGLAALTKYQAWLFLPLLLYLGALRWSARDWRAFGRSLLPALVLLALWGGVALQWQGYGGVRPAYSWELWPRAATWLPLLSGLAVWPLWLPALWPAARGVRGRLLWLFALGFLALHWLAALPPWERYLLPLLPVIAVLSADTLTTAARRLSRHSWAGNPKDGTTNYTKDTNAGRIRAIRAIRSAVCSITRHRRRHIANWCGWAIALAAIVALTLPAAVAAREARRSADGGAAAVAPVLADAPYGTVLYDHWYSWQWRYHYFDTGVYVSWVPHADALIDDLAVFADDRRFLALPADARAAPFLRRLDEAGYALEPLASAGEIRLYHILAPHNSVPLFGNIAP